MNSRIKSIRKSLDLTQQDFADAISVSQNTIAGYESARRTPSNAVISSICNVFNVNEEWLRTGKGEMFLQKNMDEEIATFIGDIQFSEDPTFKKRFISMLAKLKPEQWELLEEMAMMLAENNKDQKKD